MEDCRELVAKGDSGELHTLTQKKSITAGDHQPADPLREAVKGLVEFFLITGLHDLELEPEGTRRVLSVPDLPLGNSRVGGVDGNGKRRRLGHELVQQLHSFLTDLHRDLSCTRYVAAWPRDIADKT